MNESENKRRTRGWILEFLAQEPVGGDGRRAQVRPERLQALLFEVSFSLTMAQVMEEVGYLADKRYVEVEKFTGAAARIRGVTSGVRLLAGGMDLLDQTVRDPGVSCGAAG